MKRLSRVLFYAVFYSSAKLEAESWRSCGLLGYVCFRRQRTLGENGILLPEKELGLIPVGAIRRRIHLVQQNTMTSKIDKEDPRVVRRFKVRYGTEDWENELYHVNRFFDEGLEGIAYVGSNEDCEE